MKDAEGRTVVFNRLLLLSVVPGVASTTERANIVLVAEGDAATGPSSFANLVLHPKRHSPA